MNRSADIIRQRLENYLKGKPYRFNPDGQDVDAVLNGLAMRKQKFGEEYCPCRRLSGDAEKDRDIICPCVFHETEIAEDGHCQCHLFVKK
ncbi:MAG: ferredoxin:thioredoxin reductase [Planctomycetota bacterium]|nr:ferredoxin:thioredoxin reductase [Planctomycetota bacterium]